MNKSTELTYSCGIFLSLFLQIPLVTKITQVSYSSTLLGELVLYICNTHRLLCHICAFPLGRP